jgi:hypothetical protein
MLECGTQGAQSFQCEFLNLIRIFNPGLAGLNDDLGDHWGHCGPAADRQQQDG